MDSTDLVLFPSLLQDFCAFADVTDVEHSSQIDEGIVSHLILLPGFSVCIEIDAEDDFFSCFFTAKDFHASSWFNQEKN